MGRERSLRFVRPGLALAALAALAGAAASAERLEIPRADGPIVVDARLDEAAWQGALVVELPYETDPGENLPAPLRTVCRLLYSETHLYWGCHAFDPRPEAIRARVTDRDRSQPEDDAVTLFVDPFHDQNRAYLFEVNALGVQNDRIYIEAAKAADPSWDAIWSSAGRIVADGYVVEASIPFSSLRFPRGGGRQTWSLNFRRSVPRDVNRHLALNPVDRGNHCRLCQTSPLEGFEGIDPGRNLELIPTLVSLRASERQRRDDGSTALVAADPSSEAGLTARWGMTPSMILSLTLNPDFSQVEADVAQLDINEKFALFYPERRPFFLEGSELFSAPLRAVHTRTLAAPEWGLKLTGREGPHGVGAFVVRDAITNLLFPGAESSAFASLDEPSTGAVLRYQHNVAVSSTVGLLATRRSAGDYSNDMLGLDAHLRLGDHDTLDGQLLRSSTRYPASLAAARNQPLEPFSDELLYLGYRHQRRLWSARATYRDAGEGFRADLGFIPRVGLRETRLGGARKWFADDRHWFTTLELGADWARSETPAGGLLEESSELHLGYAGALQSSLVLSGGSSDRTFAGVSFAGQRFLALEASMRPGHAVTLGLQGWAGDTIDFTHVRAADQLTLAPSLELNAGRHVQATLRHTLRRLDVAGGTLFRANLSELRLVYQIDSRTFVRAILQGTRIRRDVALWAADVAPTSRDLLGQFLFSYKLNPRTAVFLGTTGEYRNLEPETDLTQVGGVWFLKLTYSWLP